jgi:hypothetical protein
MITTFQGQPVELHYDQNKFDVVVLVAANWVNSGEELDELELEELEEQEHFRAVAEAYKNYYGVNYV